MSAVPAGVVPVVPRAGLDPSFQPPPGATCLSEASRTYLLDGTVYRPQAPWTRRSTRCYAIWSPSATAAPHASSARASTPPGDSNCGTSTANPSIPTRGRMPGSSRSHDFSASFTTQPPPSTRRKTPCGCAGTRTARRRIPSSGTATSARGTSSPATHCRSPSSTGSSPAPSIDSTRSPKPPGSTAISTARRGEPARPTAADVRARQLALFVDSYGLDQDQRAQLVPRTIECAVRACANDCDEAVITPEFEGPHPMVWSMAWQIRGARWILDHADVLVEAIGATR